MDAMSTITPATIQSQLPFVERLLGSNKGDISAARKELKNNRQLQKTFEACVGYIKEQKGSKVKLLENGRETGHMVALHSSAPKNQRPRFKIDPSSTNGQSKTAKLPFANGQTFINGKEVRDLLKQHFTDGDRVRILTAGGVEFKGNLEIGGCSTFQDRSNESACITLVNANTIGNAVDCMNGATIEKIPS